MTSSRSGSTGGGGRSVTRMPDVTSRRVNEKPVTVEFDPRTFENWNIPNDERIRKKILSHIAIWWRDFKTRMTRQYVFDFKQNDITCRKYKITEEEWMQFKESRLTPEWQDDLVDQHSQGTFVAQGREDLLVATTGRLDCLGRVHGVGGAIGLRDYFGPKPRSTEAVTQEMEDAPTDDPTAPRVSTKGSCSTADRTDYNIQYEFLVDEDPSHVVAVGRQITRGQTIHGAPLWPTHAWCNKQNDSWACGYYIMSWMKEIIRAEIRGEWTKWFNTISPLSTSVITTIREDWAQYLNKHFK
ncbi:hypothetical protein LR48_Vigan07g171300 [Vigna angularis]|uniref:Ubiquitin-like protease family profile domain-containing protein n=1 Tax=Phaseolus angularis TaxID=3914 RepID=A0A0L9UZQ9_PHAAN|nr:hypothetical protein LR48_Vigan07g171300 [Vigna angularis]